VRAKAKIRDAARASRQRVTSFCSKTRTVLAAVHAGAQSAAATDWTQIVGLYGLLLRADPSRVAELNRAVAVAMRDGPLAGLELIDTILVRGDLAGYHLAHSARAELCRRLARMDDALALTQQEPERQFLESRLHQLD
jgi:RNA polymerase sigma-70 factor (ECF subfamily)